MRKKRYFLRLGDDPVEDAEPHNTLKDATLAYKEVADELDQYGQPIEASIHIAPSKLKIDEYPDYVLSLGPRGGVRVDRT